jgi:hypothetical protein
VHSSKYSIRQAACLTITNLKISANNIEIAILFCYSERVEFLPFFLYAPTINFFPCASGGPCPDFSFEVKPSLPLKDNSLEPPSPTTAAETAETHPDARRKLFRPYCLDDPPATDQKPPLAAYIAAAAAPGSWWVPPPGSYSPLDLSSKVLPSSPPSLELKVCMSLKADI